jgi:hypothetical protein
MATSLYESEDSLVESLINRLAGLDSPWGLVKVSREFDYQGGRTDVVAVTAAGCVVAFEAKLTKWRRALDQAYRNRCFANVSFVVLPKDAARRAASFPNEFRRRGVGICYVCEDEGLVVIEQASSSDPVLPWLHTAALECVTSET